MSPQLRALYQAIDLTISTHTLAAITDRDVDGEPRREGMGAFNTVYAVALRDAAPDSPGLLFKPLQKRTRSLMARDIGVDPGNARLANRNLASVAYDQLLKFDVIVPTRVAALTIQRPGTADVSRFPQERDHLLAPRGQDLELSLGLLMDRAKGHSALSVGSDVLAIPTVIREVTKLQLFDHLVGQVDRHANNYFVDLGPGGSVKVTGIDNDFCFGANTVHPDQISVGSGNIGFNGTRLPPLIDREMADAILGLTPGLVHSTLTACDLRPDEIDAALARLQIVQRHVEELGAQGRVIDPRDWEDEHVLALLKPSNSYAQRDMAWDDW